MGEVMERTAVENGRGRPSHLSALSPFLLPHRQHIPPSGSPSHPCPHHTHLSRGLVRLKLVDVQVLDEICCQHHTTLRDPPLRAAETVNERASAGVATR